jgi:hypothetical protein
LYSHKPIIIIRDNEYPVGNRTPYGKRLQGTDDLHEIIIDYKQSVFRILYTYESNGNELAVLLVAGDKKGNDRFYDEMIPAAERQLKEYRSDE